MGWNGKGTNVRLWRKDAGQTRSWVQNKVTNAKDISDQLEAFKLNYIKTLKEEMLEGELIKRQVDEDLEREK